MHLVPRDRFRDLDHVCAWPPYKLALVSCRWRRIRRCVGASRTCSLVPEQIFRHLLCHLSCHHHPPRLLCCMSRTSTSCLPSFDSYHVFQAVLPQNELPGNKLGSPTSEDLPAGAPALHTCASMLQQHACQLLSSSEASQPVPAQLKACSNKAVASGVSARSGDTNELGWAEVCRRAACRLCYTEGAATAASLQQRSGPTQHCSVRPQAV